MLYLNAAALQETAPVDLLNLLSVIWPGRLCTAIADTLSAETKAIAQSGQHKRLTAGSNFRYDGWDSERWRATGKPHWSLVEMDVCVCVNLSNVSKPELFYERMSACMRLTPWYHFHHFRFSSFCFTHNELPGRAMSYNMLPLVYFWSKVRKKLSAPCTVSSICVYSAISYGGKQTRGNHHRTAITVMEAQYLVSPSFPLKTCQWGSLIWQWTIWFSKGFFCQMFIS